MSAEAEDAKARGMALADLPDWDGTWRWRLLNAVREVCRTKELFTSDDIQDLVGDLANDDDRKMLMLGGVMRRAAKEKWCRKSDQMPWNSRRAIAHAKPCTVWESLIFIEGFVYDEDFLG